MAKRVPPDLRTRTARAKLTPSGKPYYHSLTKVFSLGYRKGLRGGRWVLRRYLADVKDYDYDTFADADDVANADGVEVLTFDQAQDWARARMKALAEEERIAALGPVILVRDAINEYVAARETEDRGQVGFKRDARSRLTRHVLNADEKLASTPMADLTADDLARWREGLKMAPATIQRVTSDLKAALNRAARRSKAQLPPTIRDTIRDGLAKTTRTHAVAREAQVLPDADVRAIISAAWEVDAEGEWGGDLAGFVIVLGATGARPSQIMRMTVADVQFAQKRLMVPVSRKGRGSKSTSHIGVRVGDDVLAVLAKATAGRKGSERLLLRPHWKQIAVTKWVHGERGPWFASSELLRPWKAIIARAGLAPGTVPYALRHSSIVRGLRAGLPVRLVAALHNTSSAMIEQHYAAFIVDAMDELAARAVVPLTTPPVTPLAAVRR